MKLLTCILLSLISRIALAITSCIAIPFTIVKAIKEKKSFKLGYYFGSAFYADAFGRDKIANVVLAPWLNKYFITQDSPYKFGSSKHSISLIIGKNFYNKTLLTHKNKYKSGMYWYNFLEEKEPGHCQLAIMDFETTDYYIPKNLI